jgi:hypothetical protein
MNVKVNALISGQVRNFLHIHIKAKITNVKTQTVRYVSYKIISKTKRKIMHKVVHNSYGRKIKIFIIQLGLKMTGIRNTKQRI